MMNRIKKIFIISIAFLFLSSSAFSKDTIKIAMIEPMSGPLAAIGLDLIEGLEFFAERINKAAAI